MVSQGKQLVWNNCGMMSPKVAYVFDNIEIMACSIYNHNRFSLVL